MSLNRLLGLAGLLALAACRESTVAMTPEPVVPTSAPKAATAVSKVEPKPEPKSAFVPVATNVTATAKLYRPVHGPVLLVDAYRRVIYETTPSGTIRPFAPAVSYLGEHVDPWLFLGRVASVWPTSMTIELVSGGRIETHTEMATVDLAHGTTKAAGKTLRIAAMPWRDGRTLATVGPTDNNWETDHASFTIASGKPSPVPKLPPHAIFHGDFVAYESGAVFAIGSFPKDEDAEPTTVFSWADGVRVTSTKMPSGIFEIVRGRTATETLLLGGDFVQRYSENGWVDVPLPEHEDLRSLAIADDGVAWLVVDKALYRAELPGLAWKREPLPPDFDPQQVQMTSSEDVWLTDGLGALLHRGSAPAGEPIELPVENAEWVRMAGRDREPDPFFDKCASPVVILGDVATTSESAVRAVQLPEAGTFEIGQYRSGQIFAFVPAGYDREDNIELRGSLPSLRKTFPNARLACGQPSLVKQLE